MVSEIYDPVRVWEELRTGMYRQKGEFSFLKDPEKKIYIPTEDERVQICTVLLDPNNENKAAALLYRPYFREVYTDSKRHLELVELMRCAEHVAMAAYNKYHETEPENRKYLALELKGSIKKQVNRTRGGLMTVEMKRKRSIPGSPNDFLAFIEFYFQNHKGEEVAEGILKALSFFKKGD